MGDDCCTGLYKVLCRQNLLRRSASAVDCHAQLLTENSVGCGALLQFVAQRSQRCVGALQHVPETYKLGSQLLLRAGVGHAKEVEDVLGLGCLLSKFFLQLAELPTEFQQVLSVSANISLKSAVRLGLNQVSR